MPSIEDLQQRWNQLYRTTLPELARAKDNVQPKWPVQLDHCFARIVLDNAVGITRPWTEVIKSPAWRNMTRDQLMDAIELGESIAVGEASLTDLDEKSLELRGKASKRGTKRKKPPSPSKDEEDVTDDDASRSRDREQHRRSGKVADNKSQKDSISAYFKPKHTAQTPVHAKADDTSTADSDIHHAREDDNSLTNDDQKILTNPITDAKFPASDPLTLISTSKLSTFRKEVLMLLCRVPRGRYTTYAAMSDHISKTSHKTCARAVGNAMRNNPFAPVVPCHRVLAHDGQIGGFGGHWGEDGKYAGKKMEMLRAEGVKFDGRKRAIGEVFRDFRDFSVVAVSDDSGARE